MKSIIFPEKSLEDILKKVENLEAFPQSGRYFEETHSLLKKTIDAYGYKIAGESGKFLLLKNKEKNLFELIYEKNLFSDYLELIINYKDSNKHILLSRKRGGIFEKYCSSINKEENLFEKIMSELLGEFHPLEFKKYDEKKNLIQRYNYLNALFLVGD